MTRDPRWSDADAAEFAALIAVDDGLETPLLLDDPEGGLDVGGALIGSLGPADVIDFVPVELRADGLYTFLVEADGTEIQLSLFDAEGYLLLFTDAGSFALEGDGVDTVYQYLPDEAGTYYLSVLFADPAAAGSYELAGAVDFGEEAGGNTQPLAIDGGLLTPRFAAVSFDPAADDFDADGDALVATGIAAPPANGIAGVVDGQVIYRSGSQFTGEDSFSVTVSDPSGASDTAQIFVTVGEESDPDGATIAEAQVIAFLYEAGLNRNGDIDEPGLNFWIGALVGGASFREIARAFLESDEFTAAYGAVDTLTDDELVTELFRNVLDRDPDQGGLDFWNAQLARDDFTREDLLLAFAESGENLFGTPEVATLEEDAEGVWSFGDPLG